MYRVWKTAKYIAKKEGADMFVVELAALLHDLDDWKITNSEEPEQAIKWMKKLSLDKKTIEHVREIIKNISYKGAKVRTPMRTKEGKIVQDADRLDGIGAIGIARTFAYGGRNKREIHNPETKPKKHKTFKQYKTSKSTSLNHFYEKLLLLKDRMNTETAKKIAEGRHEFLKLFLDEFLTEWEGKA